MVAEPKQPVVAELTADVVFFGSERNTQSVARTGPQGLLLGTRNAHGDPPRTSVRHTAEAGSGVTTAEGLHALQPAGLREGRSLGVGGEISMFGLGRLRKFSICPCLEMERESCL
jgi:hypothetical protein